MSNFRKELESAISRCSQENGSNTPDFILADYLANCLLAFDNAVNAREQWHDRPVGWRGPLQMQSMDWGAPDTTPIPI